MSYEDFTKMSVWQLAFDLLLMIYKETKTFPPEEKFVLVSDMRRAANSITHNIAEGFGRYESRDKTRFYKIARGSSYELISQPLISQKLEYIKNYASGNKIIEQCKGIIGELNAIIKTIETTQPSP